MKMDGTVDPDRLVSEINRQVESLHRCVALIRRTDRVVGSLNLEIEIGTDGAVAVDLQSPVNPEAEQCLLEGTRGWTVASARQGRAMLLLVLQDQRRVE